MPGSFDLPLSKLTSYEGTNPRPSNFDEFWDAQLAKLDAIDTTLKLVPAHYTSPHFAECFDAYFTGVGGAQIHARYVRPKHQKGKNPVVIMFHGYGWHSEDWFSKLPYVAQGMSVFAMDCRGQGPGSQDFGGIVGDTCTGHLLRGVMDDPEKLIYTSIYLDAAQLIRCTKNLETTDLENIYTAGVSQGGALALVSASLEPSVAKVFTQYPFLCDFQRAYEMDLPDGCYSDIKFYFRKYDPLHKAYDSFFTKLGYIDTQFFCPRIRANVLFLVGLNDITCPPSTQFAAYNKISSKKELAVYPDFAHGDSYGLQDVAFEFLAS